MQNHEPSHHCDNRSSCRPHRKLSNALWNALGDEGCKQLHDTLHPHHTPHVQPLTQPYSTRNQAPSPASSAFRVPASICNTRRAGDRGVTSVLRLVDMPMTTPNQRRVSHAGVYSRQSRQLSTPDSRSSDSARNATDTLLRPMKRLLICTHTPQHSFKACPSRSQADVKKLYQDHIQPTAALSEAAEESISWEVMVL